MPTFYSGKWAAVLRCYSTLVKVWLSFGIRSVLVTARKSSCFGLKILGLVATVMAGKQKQG